MTVVGICMVKDEEDIIGFTLPRMARQLDHVIIADNMSSDETPLIIEHWANQLGNISWTVDWDPAYVQAEKMTKLAELAREKFDASWIVPFDADEVWYSFGNDLKDHFIDVPEWSVEFATLFDHVVTVADDSTDEDPIKRISWKRRIPAPLPKVAFRPLPGFQIEMGNHGVRFPGVVGTLEDSGIVIHHYPYRSVEQMARKARNGAEAYRAAGDRVPSGAGQHWRDYGRFLDEKGISAIDEIFHTWFYSADPDNDPTLINDPCPIRVL